MQKRLSFSFLFLIATLISVAQLKSPEEFLGYKIGDRFTPHWKIVNYFNHVAAGSPSTVKLEQYGETNEGRPLLLATISSPANISNLENIRKNNLRLAGMGLDKTTADENSPAVVWLSYNVHGNETSSSEAAMLTIWALADPSNTNTKAWLKNTVVIIDPCLNPDGRDRYVNWFNTTVGKNANPQRISREHRENWPSGRTNHYYFDLNRDWAWQTQVESQLRMKKYNQWMPQVHVDFHEQGYNEPYYFAPAAEPLHEVITPWQREFQKTIGKNHAAYFDRNGWLYFTRERFDLFYPSYGDTYPVFNGAIGMTYEQGGSGAAVIVEEGDTLTLFDRVTHHFTTGLSTIEVSSQHAARLVKEFRKFFNDAVSTGGGEYKTYIIKYDVKQQERIEKLAELLDNNGIRYSKGNSLPVKGYNYVSGKEESFTAGSNDMVISTVQPRSALVKVLFEPKSKLADSVTYDITAWSLPYAYGLTAWASKDRITSNGEWAPSSRVPNVETEYGYILPWKGVKAVKAMAQLMKKGILLRYAENDFEINGNKFDRGAIIILKTSNKKFGKNLWQIVREVADGVGVQLFPVS
ncbi:MAG: zinc carboxypeptidase, partial [Ferruginibacter sp.]|nr:zinc carboxypeptidase [Chitinophagaceae bacterium]